MSINITDKYMRPVQESDFATIMDWAHARNMEAIPRTQLPQFGLIVPGIAVCFLVQTDSTIALIEGFIANKSASRASMLQAMEAIHHGLLDKARQEGYEKVFIFTEHPTVMATCKRNKYMSLGEISMFSVEL